MDPNDPDRHLKRLAHVMGVSKRIQSLALKKRRSVKVETKEELTEKILVTWHLWYHLEYQFIQ